MNDRLFTFVAGNVGAWKVTRMTTLCGDALPSAHRLSVLSGTTAGPSDSIGWSLRGVTSNERYVTRGEKNDLVARQPALGRPDARCAALIPIRKTAAWWALTPDERRQIFEEQSHHTATGMKYLPAIARRLHHCRDLGTREPFDFLTWFEFAEADGAAFDDLLSALRASPEWRFVDREIDLRLVRDNSDGS